MKAWSDPELKAPWFIGPPDWTATERTLEVRVGGEERVGGRFELGRETLFAARCHHVVPTHRLVYVYDIHLHGVHHSVSQATVEFSPDRHGTRLPFTQQVAFLDGTTADAGVPSRRTATERHLDRLGNLIGSVTIKTYA